MIGWFTKTLRGGINADFKAPAVCRSLRLRRPVRPAHRAPRARPSRLFGNRAVRHLRAGDLPHGALRHHPLGRPGLRVRGRRPRHGREDLLPWHPRSRLLLRPADHVRQARRRGRPHREGRVRPRHHHAPGRKPHPGRHAGHPDRVDEPPRRRLARAGGLHHHVDHRRLPRRLDGGRQPQPLCDAVPPRGAPHRLRQVNPGELPVWRLRPQVRLDHGQHHRREGRGDPPAGG